jgi:hypothetical protein
VKEVGEAVSLKEEPDNGEYDLTLSVDVLVALSLVPGLFHPRISEPPKVLAVPGLNTTDGVAVKEDLVKVKYKFEFGSTGGSSTPIGADLGTEGIG